MITNLGEDWVPVHVPPTWDIHREWHKIYWGPLHMVCFVICGYSTCLENNRVLIPLGHLSIERML